MKERWLPVPGFDTRYEVSNHGRVRNSATGHVLRPGLQTGGYPSVMLGRRNTRCVHTLVLLAFVGPRPVGADARHLNGVPQDNRVENLAWATRGRNVQDYKWHGKPRRLRVEQITTIRAMLREGLSERTIASIYEVAPNAIRNIKIGRAHADVP